MAKQMFFSDPNNDYSESYWFPVDLRINKLAKYAQFTFHGFKNKLARNSSKPNIGSKSYYVNVDKFDNYFSIEKIEGVGKNIFTQCYQFAIDTKDTKIDGLIGKSFFEGAIDV